MRMYCSLKKGKIRSFCLILYSVSKKLLPFKNPCIIHHLFNKECDGLKWVTCSNGLNDKINN